MNTQILPRGVTCIMVSIITIYIKEKRTHAAERALSLPACPWELSGQISTSQIHPAALCSKPDPAQILARMPYFTTTVNTSSIMGTKFYFLPSFAFKWRWHHPCVRAANERGGSGGPGGLQPTLRSPARPAPGGGKTWPTSTPRLLGHPPPPPHSFLLSFIYFNTCLSLQPQLPAAQGCEVFL